ncbi:Ig-like domain-containing protein [Catenovulum maritimum]|uniref:BIG2 domain-containing protein n=1 Tax=Catenovulum maritimum TaxID=1513271 RepID=A0A0J8H0U8_9ALTE|nr:Ig-like domain-containing protein [Catenovulum maritimum]KMT67074.1 hypothetical protein XM47_00320 [Catenovulum maritimum]
MKTNLLKKSILAAVVTSALASCGGDIDGYSNEGFNSDSPITFVEEPGQPLTGETLETPVAILDLYEELISKREAFAQPGITTEEAEALSTRMREIDAELATYEVRFNLLKNALSGDTNLGDVADATVYLYSISYEGEERSPTVPGATFVVDGTELVVRPYRLARALTENGPTNSGTYRINYSMDNGYEYNTDLTTYGLELDTDPQLVRNADLATELWLYPSDSFEIPAHPITGLPVARVEARTLWDANGDPIKADPNDPESEQATKNVLVAIDSTIRTFELTIKALRDPVLGLFTQHDAPEDAANDGQIPVIEGTTNSAIVRGLPLNQYDAGFRGWTWASEDPTIASVDEQGNITGHLVGQTTVVTATIPADWYDVDPTLPEGFSPVQPAAEDMLGKTTIRLEVNVVEAPTGSESIAISDTTDQALPDSIELPSCSAVPFKAIATAKAGEMLNGDFLYKWDYQGELNTNVGSHFNNSTEKSGRAVFQAKDIYHWRDGTPDANMASISVSLTGVEPAQTDTLDISIVENIACKKKRDDASPNWTYNGKYRGDFEYDALPTGEGSFFVRGGQGGSVDNPPTAALSLENGVTGKGLGIKFQTDLDDSKLANGWYYFIGDSNTYQGRSRAGIEYNDWGGASASLFKGEFGMVSGPAKSYGKKVKPSVWVKVTNKAQLDQDITMDFYFSPGGPVNTNLGNNRYDPAMLMTAQVKPLIGVWQLVTFKDPKTDLDYIQLPEEGDNSVTWFGHNVGRGGNNVYPMFFFHNVNKDDAIVIDNWAFTSPE